jgi:hypothetical protein
MAITMKTTVDIMATSTDRIDFRPTGSSHVFLCARVRSIG